MDKSQTEPTMDLNSLIESENEDFWGWEYL